MKNALLAFFIFATLFMSGLAIGSSSNVFAADPIGTACSSANNQAEVCKGTNTSTDPLVPVIRNIAKLIAYITGIVSVIMIIVAGIMYATAGDDSSRISGAKNTIIFAIVGLIIAALSGVIAVFLTTRVL